MVKAEGKVALLDEGDNVVHAKRQVAHHEEGGDVHAERQVAHQEDSGDVVHEERRQVAH